MTTNQPNGAKRQNFVVFTLQAARDGEAQFAKSGKPWRQVRAFYSQGKDKQLDEFLPSIWFNVKAFGKGDEIEGPVAAVQQLAKGDKFTVVGRLGMDEWTGDDGATRQAFTIYATSLEPFQNGNDEAGEDLAGEPA